MLLLAKKKKGVSIMIGYVLLIVVAITMSVIVYAWLKTYVPTEDIKCEDGVSLFIKDYTYNCAEKTFEIILKNNGKFNIAAYLIHATTNKEQELATKDLTEFFNEAEAIKMNTGIKFSTIGENTLAPEIVVTHTFNLGETQIYSIEIVPMRYEIINNKNSFISCSNAKVKQEVSCS